MMRAFTWIALVCVWSWVAANAVLADPPDPAGGKEGFAKLLPPFVRTYCIKCHGGNNPKGELSLEQFQDATTLVTQRPHWLDVLERLRAGEMPPEKQPMPGQDERNKVVAWLEAELAHVDCTVIHDPGRVTIRRLNREEYKNTIRDLIGVDFKPADDFPADDVGYGFDNIGDVLSLSPLLLEKYVEAAEQIAQTAIVAPELIAGANQTFPAEKLSGGQDNGGARILTSVGRVEAKCQCEKNGRYVIKTRVFADQAGPELAKMELLVDGRHIKTVQVAATSADPQVFTIQAELTAGAHTLAAGFLNDYFMPKDPDPANRDRNLWVELIEMVGPVDAIMANPPETHKRIITYTPGEQQDAASCARTILRAFASRAYRRDVSDEEVERLARFVEMVQAEGESFERGVQLAVQAVLCSPSFLFRGEFDAQPDNPAQVHPVSEMELASRLSYFLWSSMPDDELFALARRGELRKQVREQVRRMLADARAQALVKNFGDQWLQIRRLAIVSPDPKQFPAFDEELRQAMLEESEQFFAAVMREDRSVMDFLDGRYTFVNERLARHYGIEGVQGDVFRRVELDGTQRGGVLTQASVLTVTSNPTRTSPVKRGKWILEQILGAPPPPPPPNVPELDTAKELTGSLRQRLEQHRANESCANCHRRMDPLGFALENYDAVGAWRTQDGEFAVDPSGELPDGTKFSGPVELKKVLTGRREAFRRSLAEKMLTYALGRGVEFYDTCALDEICRQMAASEDRFSSLVLAIVQSDSFQLRRGDGEKP